MRVALILDDMSLAKWQRIALDIAKQQIDISLIVSCINTKTKKKLWKNFLYYIINLFTLRNNLTKKIDFFAGGVKCIEFESVYEGNWQRLPDEVVEEIKSRGISVVVKFGMSLLKISENMEGIRVLSFHHGDPSRYRGRPAGFYEMLDECDSVGSIVQELSNTLDAGRVWAIGHSKIFHYSYKKTAVNFYANSTHLLKKALINLQLGHEIKLRSLGVNYRLPSNYLVVKFLVVTFLKSCRRYWYGAFFEKRWNISRASGFDLLGSSEICINEMHVPVIPSGYEFYADPFYSADGETIRLEALKSSNGLGDIIELDSSSLNVKRVLFSGAHYSFPISFVRSGVEYLLPEVASHSGPYYVEYPFDAGCRHLIKGLEHLRVVDGTLFEYNGIFYFFCGLSDSASDCLYLYYSSGLDLEFTSHPLNPVVIDPARARMGGRIVFRNNRIYRIGQNNCFHYGNGVSVCEIVSISPTSYSEVLVNSIRVSAASGPHTLDVFEDECVIDFYTNKFSPFAWYRRLAPMVIRRLLK